MLAEATKAVAGVDGFRAPGVVNPIDRSRRIHAVLFDLDGTLYRQRPMRVRMAAELAAFMLKHPLRGRTVASVLGEYRRAQEFLRRDAQNGRPCRQADIAAERTGVD